MAPSESCGAGVVVVGVVGVVVDDVVVVVFGVAGQSNANPSLTRISTKLLRFDYYSSLFFPVHH